MANRHDNNVLIRSGEALGVGWSRNMLYSGFSILPRSVVRRQTGFAARITRALSAWMPQMAREESKQPKRTYSDRIGFLCSAFLLSLLLVFAAIVLEEWYSDEPGSNAAAGIVLVFVPSVMAFLSFVCWMILYLCGCGLRYHASWIIALISSFLLVVINEIFTH